MSDSFYASLFGLTGKTALVTGGTRGIGRTMALALAQAGADIILVQRNKTNLETYNEVKALGRSCSIVEADLADEAAVKGLAHQVTGKKAAGGLEIAVDVLLNCGGIVRRGFAEEYAEVDWDEIMQVNVKAVWTLSRDFGKHMLESRGGVTGKESPEVVNPRGRAKIINVASVCAIQGTFGRLFRREDGKTDSIFTGGVTVSGYTASKHAVLGLTKALSNEWAGRGINVNCFAPGYIATDMNQGLMANTVRFQQISERIPAGRWGKAEDFEGIALFLASRASDYICGECITVDGGWMVR